MTDELTTKIDLLGYTVGDQQLQYIDAGKGEERGHKQSRMHLDISTSIDHLLDHAVTEVARERTAERSIAMHVLAAEHGNYDILYKLAVSGANALHTVTVKDKVLTPLHFLFINKLVRGTSDLERMIDLFAKMGVTHPYAMKYHDVCVSSKKAIDDIIIINANLNLLIAKNAEPGLVTLLVNRLNTAREEATKLVERQKMVRMQTIALMKF